MKIQTNAKFQRQVQRAYVAGMFVKKAVSQSATARRVGPKMRILGFVFIVSVLSVISCPGSEARAVDRSRIDTIEPSVVDRGGEFTLRGVDLLCSGNAHWPNTRVQMRWRTGRVEHMRYPQLSVILDNEIRAQVPGNIAPGEYTIYVVTHDERSRQLECQSNAVILTVRQPAPPAVGADSNQVMSNPCLQRTPADIVAAGPIGSSPPTCRYPMKLIQLNRDGRTAINPAALLSIGGITLQDQNMVIAILRGEQRFPGGPVLYPYFVVRLLRVNLRRPALVVVQVPYDLESGRYKVAALYRFGRDRSLSDLRADPIGTSGSGRVRPLFVMGSNLIDLEVTGPPHR